MNQKCAFVNVLLKNGMCVSGPDNIIHLLQFWGHENAVSEQIIIFVKQS